MTLSVPPGGTLLDYLNTLGLSGVFRKLHLHRLLTAPV